MKLLLAEHVVPIASDPIRGGAVAVESGIIMGVGAAAELSDKYPGATCDDFGEAVLMPGMVNCHGHLELTVMRGFLDDHDQDFYSWLIKLTRTRAEALTDADIFLSASVGALEAARAGVSCFGDIGRCGGAGLEALRINGLRGISFQETEFSPDDRTADADFDKLMEKFQALRENETELVKAGISPHAPYTVSRKLFGKIAEFAAENDVSLTIHAAESAAEDIYLKTGSGLFAALNRKSGAEWNAPGMSAIEFLASAGVLSVQPLLAHCVTVSDRDIELIRESGSKIAHCPKSNAKFGHGIAPLGKFLAGEIPVGFGSDSMASNNSCDMFEEARFAALMARNCISGKSFPTAEDIIRTATLGGARALGVESAVGSLEVGKHADIIAVSLTSITQMPVYDIYSSLLFGTSARDVKMTMVAGEEIFRDGIATRVDETELKTKVKELARRIN